MKKLNKVKNYLRAENLTELFLYDVKIISHINPSKYIVFKSMLLSTFISIFKLIIQIITTWSFIIQQYRQSIYDKTVLLNKHWGNPRWQCHIPSWWTTQYPLVSRQPSKQCQNRPKTKVLMRSSKVPINLRCTRLRLRHRNKRDDDYRSVFRISCP